MPSFPSSPSPDSATQRVEQRVFAFCIHAALAALAIAVIVKCSNTLWVEAALPDDIAIAEFRSGIADLAFATPFVVGLVAGYRREVGIFVLGIAAGVIMTAPVVTAHLFSG